MSELQPESKKGSAPSSQHSWRFLGEEGRRRETLFFPDTTLFMHFFLIRASPRRRRLVVHFSLFFSKHSLLFEASSPLPALWPWSLPRVRSSDAPHSVFSAPTWEVRMVSGGPGKRKKMHKPSKKQRSREGGVPLEGGRWNPERDFRAEPGAFGWQGATLCSCIEKEKLLLLSCHGVPTTKNLYTTLNNFLTLHEFVRCKNVSSCVNSLSQ